MSKTTNLNLLFVVQAEENSGGGDGDGHGSRAGGEQQATASSSMALPPLSSVLGKRRRSAPASQDGARQSTMESSLYRASSFKGQCSVTDVRFISCISNLTPG